MKSRKAKIGKEKEWQKKGRKKRLEQHQWTKVNNPPLHHHQHFKHKQSKSGYLKKTDKALPNTPHNGTRK